MMVQVLTNKYEKGREREKMKKAQHAHRNWNENLLLRKTFHLIAFSVPFFLEQPPSLSIYSLSYSPRCFLSLTFIKLASNAIFLFAHECIRKEREGRRRQVRRRRHNIVDKDAFQWHTKKNKKIRRRKLFLLEFE